MAVTAVMAIQTGRLRGRPKVKACLLTFINLIENLLLFNSIVAVIVYNGNRE